MKPEECPSRVKDGKMIGDEVYDLCNLNEKRVCPSPHLVKDKNEEEQWNM